MTLQDKLEADATAQLEETKIRDIEYIELNKHQSKESILDTEIRIIVITEESVTSPQIRNMNQDALTSFRPALDDRRLMNIQFDYEPEDVKEVTE